MNDILIVTTMTGLPAPGVTAFGFKGHYKGHAIDTILATGEHKYKVGDEALLLLEVENVEDGVIHGVIKKIKEIPHD